MNFHPLNFKPQMDKKENAIDCAQHVIFGKRRCGTSVDFQFLSLLSLSCCPLPCSCPRHSHHIVLILVLALVFPIPVVIAWSCSGPPCPCPCPHHPSTCVMQFVEGRPKWLERVNNYSTDEESPFLEWKTSLNIHNPGIYPLILTEGKRKKKTSQ